MHKPCQEGEDELVGGFVSILEDEGGLSLGRLEGSGQSDEILLEG